MIWEVAKNVFKGSDMKIFISRPLNTFSKLKGMKRRHKRIACVSEWLFVYDCMHSQVVVLFLEKKGL